MPDEITGKSNSPKRHRSWYRHQRRQELLRRWSTISVIVVFLGSLVIYQNRDFFNPLRERAALRAAHALVASGDKTGAILHTRDALHLNPRNLEGCRLLAQLLEEENLREAIDWRQRVTQIEPAADNNWIALAETAARWEEWPSVDQSLAAISGKIRGTALFHELAASSILAQGQSSAIAQTHYEQALQLDPGNEKDQLSLARLRWLSPDEAGHRAARVTLDQLRTKPAFALDALRALVAGAASSDNLPAAAAAARELAAHPNATLIDRFGLLAALKQSQPAEFTDYLRQMESLAATNAPGGGELIRWMTANGLAQPAADWGGKLPRPVAGQEPIVLALAGALTELKDWDGLENLLEPAAVRDGEFLRQAYLARAYREKSQELDSTESWRLALRAAQPQVSRLTQLAQLAGSWNWLAQAEDLWWLVVKGAVNKGQALNQLRQIYLTRQDTHGLYRVAKQLHQLQPKDVKLADDVASLALLLSVDRSSAIPLAEDNYVKESTNTSITATYLQALQVQGKLDAAVKLVGDLPAERLKEGKLPLYAGVVLTAAGKRDEARPHLEAAGKISDLLPEEKSLLADALKPAAPNRRAKPGVKK